MPLFLIRNLDDRTALRLQNSTAERRYKVPAIKRVMVLVQGISGQTNFQAWRGSLVSTQSLKVGIWNATLRDQLTLN